MGRHSKHECSFIRVTTTPIPGTGRVSVVYRCTDPQCGKTRTMTKRKGD